MGKEKEIVVPEKSFEAQIPEALAKTGFVVEHHVSEAFRAAGWGVIGSRYYIDDVDGRARELDLIVYKVSSGNEIDVVTTILISCKKDSENAWAIMSRGRPDQDPNLDWNPVHPWTNYDVLDAYLKTKPWAEKYVSGNKSLHQKIFEMRRQAFAFQLISKSSCRVKNDRPIFESLTDLLKAQNHELSLLPDRMKKKRVYVFNLATIVDTEIYEVSYDLEQPVASRVDEFRHLTRYIVGRREVVSRVNIYSTSKLKEVIKSYGSLAAHDSSFFNGKVAEAFSAITENSAVQEVIAKKLTIQLRWEIFSALNRAGRKRQPSDISISLYYESKQKLLSLLVSVDDDDIQAMSKDSKLMSATTSALKSIARYTGQYRYEIEIPF
jgi:hypothetical protein